MSNRIFLFLFLYSLTISGHGQLRFYKYPPITASGETVNRFGARYFDPYTSFENLQSDTTKAWLEAQNKFLDQYRRSLFAKYTVCEQILSESIMDFYGKAAPQKKRDFYFRLKYNRDGVPTIMFKRMRNAEYEPLCSGHDFQYNPKDKIFIRGIEVSPDNKYAAIIISHSGSDWHEIRVRDIEGNKFLKEIINWSKFSSVVWDSTGFFYSRFDEPQKGFELVSANKNERLMYHRLGTLIDSDKIILKGEAVGTVPISFYQLKKDKIIIVQYIRQEKSRVASVVAFFKPDSMQNGIKEFIIAPSDGVNHFSVVSMIGSRFLVKSTFKAPNGQVLVYDPDHINTGQNLIEQFNQPLRVVRKLKDRIFCVYYDKGKYVPIVFDTLGIVLKKLEIPDGFGVSGFDEAINDSVTLYTLSSFEEKPRTVKFDFKNLKTIVYDEAVGRLFNTTYTSKIVYYRSSDSTLIPMYIVHLKKITPDSSTPALLYSYGGFGISIDPFYNPGFNIFLKMGGVLAVPLIRGGGEMGEAWHKAGMGPNKQNSFNDFIGAAEYLIKNNYTSPNNLAITGGSNGGLLVAAAMVQKPELFKVVVPHAAVLDLVNFDKFTAAGAWTKEYGNPEDSVDFLNLLKLSPLHNLKKDVQYPACMLIASTNDDRVVPSHSYRFLASLQNDTKEKNYPYLLYSEENEGHNSEGTLDDFQQLALMYTFIFENLGVDVSKLY